MDNANAGNQRFDQRPVPDPTVLTTEALQREIAGLKEYLLGQIASQSQIDSVRFGTIAEKFQAIEDWRREQKADTKSEVANAFSAAKEAVKEQTVASEKAITKSETASAEQSKQQYATFTESIKGVSTSVQDLKDRVAKIEVSVSSIKSLEDANAQLRDRVNTIESAKAGANETKTERRSETGNLLGLLAGFTGFILFLITLAAYLSQQN